MRTGDTSPIYVLTFCNSPSVSHRLATRTKMEDDYDEHDDEFTGLTAMFPDIDTVVLEE